MDVVREAKNGDDFSDPFEKSAKEKAIKNK